MDFYQRYKSDLERLDAHLVSILSLEDPQIYGLLIPYLRAGGKRVRPLLVYLCAAASGRKTPDPILEEIASIIELFHNFTLVHDDIEDDSQFRRGQPTLHLSHGLPMALNSGDALYTLLLKRLVALGLSPTEQIKFQNLALDSFKRVVDGQGKEIFWIKENKFTVTQSEYLDMISGKTSALIGFSCRSGSFIAGADEKTQKCFERFGEKLGLAFQIHDDVLNLIGNFEKYKKEIGGDISEGKRTLMIVHCLSESSAASESERKKILSVLSSHTKDQSKIRAVITILRKSGSIDFASAFAKDLVLSAKNELSSLPSSEAKSDLLALADYFVSREQ
ncbi:polyprenyl synthetase family protein [Candidatus Micrarchaeota archaeon]|nr:polyprenyl synthetase family protein [Candidatus Micrarchaeota archaeon]